MGEPRFTPVEQEERVGAAGSAWIIADPPAANIIRIVSQARGPLRHPQPVSRWKRVEPAVPGQSGFAKTTGGKSQRSAAAENSLLAEPHPRFQRQSDRLGAVFRLVEPALRRPDEAVALARAQAADSPEPLGYFDGRGGEMQE